MHNLLVIVSGRLHCCHAFQGRLWRSIPGELRNWPQHSGPRAWKGSKAAFAHAATSPDILPQPNKKCERECMPHACFLMHQMCENRALTTECSFLQVTQSQHLLRARMPRRKRMHRLRRRPPQGPRLMNACCESLPVSCLMASMRAAEPVRRECLVCRRSQAQDESHPEASQAADDGRITLDTPDAGSAGQKRLRVIQGLLTD